MAKHLLGVWLCAGALVASCSGAKSGEDSAGTAGASAATGSSAAGSSAGAAPAGSAGSAVAGRGTAAPSGGARAVGEAQVAGVGGQSGTAGVGGTSSPVSSAGVGAAGAVAAAGRGGASGSSSSEPGSCDEPAPASELIGWAAAAGSGTDTTTGGGTSGMRAPMIVSSLAELSAAVSGDAPALVYVKGKLTAGSLKIGSNNTIAGLCDAELHGHISIDGVSNIIVRNLKIVGYGVGDCALDPKYNAAEGCSSGDDAITVQRAHHIWFDHCDVSDGTDGNLDITNGADFVTVSWTRFHYTERTDPVGNDSTGAAGHRFSNLVGGADNVPADVGHLNVTWHHNWWAEHVDQRMPRTRAGKIHVLNNLFTSSGNSYCTNAGAGASLLVEGNAYIGVQNPLQPTASGDMRAADNLFTGSSGTTTANGMGFMPPYPYTPEPASSVESAVRAGAGPH